MIVDLLSKLTANCLIALNDESSVISPSLSGRAHDWFRLISDNLVGNDLIFENKIKNHINEYTRNNKSIYLEKLIQLIQDNLNSNSHKIDELNKNLSKCREFVRILPQYATKDVIQKTNTNIDHQINSLRYRLMLLKKENSPKTEEISIVLSFRVDHKYRLRNILACLLNIYNQSLSREKIQIIAVSQDKSGVDTYDIDSFVDNYIAITNCSSFNYSWGRNVGANHSQKSNLIVFWDADILAPNNTLELIINAHKRGEKAILPYTTVNNLNDYSTSYAVSLDHLSDLFSSKHQSYISFQQMREVYGMLIAVDKALFYKIGGQDERYKGWGDEDNDFYRRLYEVSDPLRLAQDIYHMDHPRPIMRIDGEKINKKILETCS